MFLWDLKKIKNLVVFETGIPIDFKKIMIGSDPEITGAHTHTNEHTSITQRITLLTTLHTHITNDVFSL